MKLAGPPRRMEVLLLTNSPAPMMPPMEIMVRCRPLRERLNSFLPVVVVANCVILLPSMCRRIQRRPPPRSQQMRVAGRRIAARIRLGENHVRGADQHDAGGGG